MLLRRFATTMKGLENKEVRHLNLSGAIIKGDKPSLSVYVEKPNDKHSSSRIVDRGTMRYFEVRLKKGAGQDNMIAILDKVHEELKRLGEIDVFDISLEDDINEFGSRYVMTCYYEYPYGSEN